MKQNQRKKYIETIVIMGVLLGIIILMAFTPLGYLPIGPVSITLLMIPVAIGAISLGEKGGIFLGFAFGMTSFVQCFGKDFFGTYLAQQNVVFTFIMCVLMRTLAGYIAALIYKVLSKAKVPVFISCAATGLVASLSNTVLFVGSLLILFGKTTTSEAVGGILSPDLNFINFFAAFVGINAIWEALAATILVGAIGFGLYKAHLIGGKKEA